MTPTPLTLSTPFPPKQVAAAERYRPRTLTALQWEAVRFDVLDLVARCRPIFVREIAMLAGSACALIGTFAGEVEELSVGGMLTQVNVDRLLVRYLSQGMNTGSYGQQRVRLRRLLREQLGQPKAQVVPARAQRVLNPYSPGEIDALLSYFEVMPDEIRQVGFDALLLALGFGLVVPHTTTLARDEAGDLLIRGRLAGPVAAGLDPRLLVHVAYVSSVSGEEWDGLRDWLRWQGKGLDLTAQRLVIPGW